MDDRKCEMWLDLEGRQICGKAATLGWLAESGKRLVPTCDDCQKRTGQQREYLYNLNAEIGNG